MKSRVAVLVVLLAWSACHPARATTVVLRGQGLLASASGLYRAGDPFSFTTSYDDAAAPESVAAGTAFYSSRGLETDFVIDGDPYRSSILYDLTMHDGTLGITTPGDYFPQSVITLPASRTEPGRVSLPTAAELSGRTGTFSFFVVSAGQGSAGSGAFVEPGPAGVPEPATAPLVGLGLSLLLAMSAIGRRRVGRGTTRRAGGARVA